MTQTALGAALKERGFENDRYSSGSRKGRKHWKGIGLGTESQQFT